MQMTLGLVYVAVFLRPVRVQVPMTLSQAGNGLCVLLDQPPALQRREYMAWRLDVTHPGHTR